MMAFFDTSVLVAVFYGDHHDHRVSLDTFIRFSKKQAGCAAHTLAEVYSVLTGLPVAPRIGAEQAMLFVEELRRRVTVITLEENDYYAALESAARTGIVGGAVYDALIVACALKAKAETIYTWNLGHFQRFGTEVNRRVRTP